MAGYSGTPLKKKLGIKDSSTVCIVKAPKGYNSELKVVNARKGPFDFVQLFAMSRAELIKFFSVMKKRMTKDGMLWISWPKKASGVATDLDENVVREIGLTGGLVDVKVAAIDATWSGLKFVRRVRDR